MALFSDLLPYILQQQQTALPGGPNLGPAIPRSPTNVTALNMPSAKLPGAFDFANTANNFANTMGENMLRAQQAHLTDLQAQRQNWMLQNLPAALKLQMDAFQSLGGGGGAGGAGAGGSEQGGSLLQGSSTRGGAAGPDGKTISMAMQEPPEVQAAVAKKLAMESGIQHWSGIDPDTGKPWNQPLFNALQAAGLPTSGPLTEEQWAKADPLVQKYESGGGKNIPNYKFGPGFTAGGTHQITNSTWNMIGGPQIAAAMKGSAGQSASAASPVSGQTITVPPLGDTATPATPQGEIPEVPSYKGKMGETPEPPAAEDNDASLAPDESPGFAGRALAAQAMSPRDQLNQDLLARYGNTQVAGDAGPGSLPAGMGMGGAIPGLSMGDTSLPSPNTAALRMPFNPAAQQAAGPSPAVPSAPAGGPKPAGALGASPPPAYKPPSGVTLDPSMVKTLQAALMSQMTGLPGGDLLLKAYEASPAYAEQRAAATARGGYAGPSADVALQTRLEEARRQAAADIERRNIMPLAEEKARAATIPVQTFLAEAQKYPEGDPRRNFYMNQAAVASGVKEPVVPQTRPNVPAQGYDAPSNSYQPSPLGIPNMVNAATEAAQGSAIGKGRGETTPLVAPTLVPKGAAGPGFTEPLKTDAGTLIPPVSMQPPMQGTAKYQEERNSEFGKFENEWARAVSPSLKSEQRMMAIADALKSYNSGTWASNLSDLRGKLRVVGIELPDSIAGNPALAQEILKNNFSASIEQMRTTGLSRWTQAELFAAQSNTANPNLWGDANQQIIAQTVGALRWERQMNKDFLQAKSHGWQNPEAFQTYWTESPQNSLPTFVNKTSNELGAFAGARDFEVKALPNAQIGHIPNEGNAIVIDNRDGKGFVYKTGPKAGQPLSTGQAPTGR